MYDNERWDNLYKEVEEMRYTISRISHIVFDMDKVPFSSIIRAVEQMKAEIIGFNVARTAGPAWRPIEYTKQFSETDFVEEEPVKREQTTNEYIQTRIEQAENLVAEALVLAVRKVRMASLIKNLVDAYEALSWARNHDAPWIETSIEMQADSCKKNG